MKIGCFAKADQLPDVKKAGFDCAEPDICELVRMTEEEFKRFAETARESGLLFPVFSGLFPLDMRIYEENFQEEYWLAHTEKGARRAAELGALFIPFGAGKCRSIPEGCGNRLFYEEKLKHFVEKVCGVLKKNGITLLIEPLGPANSNYLNRIAETSRFTADLKSDNCHIMCDLRHMVKNGESLEEIYNFRKEILHAHIDYPLGELRCFPQRDDGYDYAPYIKMLKKSDYRGILTVEAAAYTSFREEASRSAEYLRELVLV